MESLYLCSSSQCIQTESSFGFHPHCLIGLLRTRTGPWVTRAVQALTLTPMALLTGVVRPASAGLRGSGKAAEGRAQGRQDGPSERFLLLSRDLVTC